MSDRIDAQTAADIGLVEQLAGPDELIPTAMDYVRRLADVSAPKAIAATKQLVYRHVGMGYAEALAEADRVQSEFVAAPDAAEGARALLEKRPPRFDRLGATDD